MKKIIKKRKKNKKTVFIIFFFALIICTSIGYSLLSESININGTARANYVISGNALKLNLTQNGTGGATYSSGTFPTTFATLTSEVLSGNYLTLTFTRTRTYTSYVTCSFVMNFKNAYPYTMSSGTRTNTTVSGGSNVRSFSSTLDNTSLAIGASSKLTISARLRTSLTTKIQLQTRIAYKINNVTQYFYYVIIVN